jgi:hypothetical protein
MGVVSICTLGCGGSGRSGAILDGSANTQSSGSGNQGGATGMVSDAGGSPRLCSDLFDQTVVPAYSIEITSDNWTKLDADFHDLKDVLAGTPPMTYYPVVFHYGSETVSNAAIRLRGKSSWVDTVLYDTNPKMQFDVSFDQIDTKQKFHGISTIHLTMARDDWTFMNDRIGDNWMRQIGITAPCANSAMFTVNGAYYGLYVAEGSVGTALLKQFFPGNAAGDLFKGGSEAQTNTTTANWARLQTLKSATDIASLQAIADLPNSVLEWAAEAVVDDADGYYGGSHNYFLYDEGSAGYLWIPDHTDSALEWLELFAPTVSYKEHPIYWWAGRVAPDPPGADYLLVMNDANWRGQYVNAIATQVAKWDPAEISGWASAWAPQIADAIAADPHKWATTAQVTSAMSALQDMIQNRPKYLQSFLGCEQGNPADSVDQDHDGVPWCNDCDDTNPAVHPGAPEICGNHIDDNCNGVVDENCPGETPGYPGQTDAGAPAAASGNVDGGNVDGGTKG